MSDEHSSPSGENLNLVDAAKRTAATAAEWIGAHLRPAGHTLESAPTEPPAAEVVSLSLLTEQHIDLPLRPESPEFHELGPEAMVVELERLVAYYQRGAGEPGSFTRAKDSSVVRDAARIVANNPGVVWHVRQWAKDIVTSSGETL